MAQVTKAQLIRLAEKTEGTYYDMEDELLILIANYLARGENEFTIAQMMRWNEPITREAMKIIARYAGLSLAEVEDIMNEAMEIALEETERELRDAAMKGYIQEAPPLKESERVGGVIKETTKDSEQKLKAMNNTILNSVIVEYQTAVNDVIQEKNRLQQQTYDTEVRYDPKDLQEPYRGAVYEITRDREITAKAIEKAVNKLADNGVTGYIDSAGRHWNADTYAAMVIRTNAHNVAIDATRERQADYGSDLFQISAHGGARELCYPYQGKICSWSSPTGGAFVDGAGVKREYLSLENDTSYGEPAGIFGINCGHHPMPIIPGVSIVHEIPIQPKEENDREYQESQKQRYLERQIRDAKRLYEMQKAAGAGDDALKRYRQSINDKQQDMRDFIDETGRTRRYDREKIATAPEALPVAKTPGTRVGERYDNKATKTKDGISLFHKNDYLYTWSQKVKPEEGYYDVMTHGGTDGVTFNSASNQITVEKLAEIIRSSPNYEEGRPVRLISCYTGVYDEDTTTYVGQQLANILGVEVKAPNDQVIITNKGRLKIGDGTGEFVIFTPNKGDESEND